MHNESSGDRIGKLLLVISWLSMRAWSPKTERA
jgi:hypothetical protein